MISVYFSRTREFRSDRKFTSHFCLDSSLRPVVKIGAGRGCWTRLPQPPYRVAITPHHHRPPAGRVIFLRNVDAQRLVARSFRRGRQSSGGRVCRALRRGRRNRRRRGPANAAAGHQAEHGSRIVVSPAAGVSHSHTFQEESPFVVWRSFCSPTREMSKERQSNHSINAYRQT